MTVAQKATKFTPDQRRAIETATLDNGMTAAAAARAAAAGELPGQEPFVISEQRAREFRNAARAKREIERYGGMNDTLGKCRALVEDMLCDRLMVIRGNQLKRSDRQVKELVELRDLVGDLARLERERNRARQPSKPDTEKPDEPNEAEQQRQALEARLKRREPSSTAPTPNTENATPKAQQPDPPQTRERAGRQA